MRNDSYYTALSYTFQAILDLPRMKIYEEYMSVCIAIRLPLRVDHSKILDQTQVETLTKNANKNAIYIDC